LDNSKGLGDYLEQDIELAKVLSGSVMPGLDVLSAGQAVRNPSELLHKDKFLRLLEQLRGVYDYVIIDTAPVGMVTDCIPALRSSDLSLFVLRWGHSPKGMVEAPYSLAENYGLKMVGVVVNDLKDDALFSSLEEGSGGYSNLYLGDMYSGSGKKGAGRWNIFGAKTKS
jgi:Mrp family chromosome partitioning ATPase